MKAIHVLRKPLSREASTVAANVLKHGCGAINVDGCRVGFQSDTDKAGAKPQGARTTTKSGALAGGVQNENARTEFVFEQNTLGRWPANLVLQHLDGCRCVGTRSVKTSGWRDTDAHKGDEGVSNNFGASGITGRHYGENGEETVAAWSCEPGCPVAALDTQSGVSTSTGGRASIGAFKGGRAFGVGNGAEVLPGVQPGLGDTGGASRFFKQF